MQTLTPEALASLREELIAFEMREAAVYREPMTRKDAERRVSAGLRAPTTHGD